MKSDQRFNIFFVGVVEKHEILYNYSLKGYSNKEEQEKAWTIVAREVKESISSCKDRWKNLRASLCRHLRNQAPNGADPNGLKKPYYLFDYMQFVVPYTKNRSQLKPFYLSCKTSTDEEEEDSETPVEVYMKEEKWLDSGSTPSDHLQVIEEQPSPTSSAIVPTWKMKQKRFLDQSEEDCDNHLLPSKIKKQEDQLEDADMSFLKSLIPDMKKMEDRQKNRFKRMVLETIDEILYNQS